MNQRNAPARATSGQRLREHLKRAGLAILLAVSVHFVAAVAAVESAPPSPTPENRSQLEVTPSPSPSPSPTPRPTREPTATPTATPVPAQDLAVVFFNNFCSLDQPLMATVFNTSATPLQGRTIRLRLSSDTGLMEEHDHFITLAPLANINLPLLNPARAPWVKIEIELLEAPADSNPANDSSSCGVAAPESPTAEPTAPPTVVSGRRVPPAVAGGASSESTLRQPEVTPTPPAASQVQPTRAPARAQTNSPQPSLTPIGDAGGGLPSQSGGGFFASRTLMLTGVVLLAAGSSWGFYYLTRPPKGSY
jgi:hypothetical protein